MKKLQWLKVTSGALFFGMVCFGAYAGSNNCMSNYVHCAYSTDQGGNLAGNYIQFSAYGQSTVACFPYGAAAAIDNTMIQQENLPMGKNTWQFSVCSDQQCSKSVPVLEDTFTLSQITKGQYKADPKDKAFSFAGHFPAVTCPMEIKKLPLK